MVGEPNSQRCMAVHRGRREVQGLQWALHAPRELYTQNDYKTLGLNRATATSATNMYLFLANNYQNYDARYFTISFSYHPQLLRIGRSTI